MKIDNIHWTWYMWVGIPDPGHRPGKSLPDVPKRKENKKVEKTLKTYDREGKAKKDSKRNLIVKA